VPWKTSRRKLSLDWPLNCILNLCFVRNLHDSSEDAADLNETPEPLSSEGDLSEDHAQQYAWNDFDPTAAWDSAAGPEVTEAVNDDSAGDVTYAQVDQQLLIGKKVRALYPYSAQNEDELDLAELEEVQVISAEEKDWVKATNANGTFFVLNQKDAFCDDDCTFCA
jgi:hypothetical protein